MKEQKESKEIKKADYDEFKTSDLKKQMENYLKTHEKELDQFQTLLNGLSKNELVALEGLMVRFIEIATENNVKGKPLDYDFSKDFDLETEESLIEFELSPGCRYFEVEDIDFMRHLLSFIVIAQSHTNPFLGGVVNVS